MNDYLENESNKVKIIVRIRNPIRRDKYEKEFLDLDETVKKYISSGAPNTLFISAKAPIESLSRRTFPTESENSPPKLSKTEPVISRISRAPKKISENKILYFISSIFLLSIDSISLAFFS